MASPQLFASAVHLNNEGAYWLENCSLERARLCFHSALDIVKECTRQNKDQGIDEVGDGSMSYGWSESPNVPLHTTSDRPKMFIFQRAVSLRVCGDEDDSCDYQVASGGIIFNLALTYHLMGILTCSKAHLQSALRFYQVMINVVQQQKDGCGYDEILEMALMNNIGQLFSEFSNSQASQRCFGLLSQILRMIDPMRLSSCDADGFALNILSNETQMLAAAA